jgi:Protein of unknown function (DUF3606)
MLCIHEETHMPDDRQNRGAPDNRRIDVSDEHELRNWAQSLRVTPEQIRDAVSKVGTSAQKVREHLRAS